MRARIILISIVALAAIQSDVHGLTPPSSSDGPVKLLTCVVSPQGILEAEVVNQTDDAMDCYIRFNYEMADHAFSHGFNVTIPRRYQGRVGRFDTSNARAGNYSGDIGSCKKIER